MPEQNPELDGYGRTLLDGHPDSDLDRPTVSEHEAPLADGEFEVIRRLLHHIAGIHLADSRRDLVRVRLGRRLRALGGITFERYVEFLQSPEGSSELVEMVDALTTNKTDFFREPIHFDFLSERVLPELLDRGDPIRIWSAGSSTGEEPYSLAMTVLEEVDRIEDHDIRILGTDISSRVISAARAGIYRSEAVQGLDPSLRDRYFHRRIGEGGIVEWEISAEVRSLVSLARLNLMGEWPMRRKFDLIFCRNVMLYFDAATRQRLVRRFEGQLKEGGYLFVGHTESLTTLFHGLTYIQPAVYRK